MDLQVDGNVHVELKFAATAELPVRERDVLLDLEPSCSARGKSLVRATSSRILVKKKAVAYLHPLFHLAGGELHDSFETQSDCRRAHLIQHSAFSGPAVRASKNECAASSALRLDLGLGLE